MAEEKEKLVFIATHAEEEPEVASFPFLLANAAQAMDVEAVVLYRRFSRAGDGQVRPGHPQGPNRGGAL